jgi:hypothetical protein
VEGSYKLAGADLMKNGTAVYQILRLNGYQEGLEPLLEELGTRFARPSKKKAPETESLDATATDFSPINESPSLAMASRSGTLAARTARSEVPDTAKKNAPSAHHLRQEATTWSLRAFTGRRFRRVPQGSHRQIPYTARPADLGPDPES